jgi:hypothetical protein
MPRALRALVNDALVTRDGPHLPAELEPLLQGWEHCGSRRPCHPRAISSGHERYLADNHGHSERITELVAVR